MKTSTKIRKHALEVYEFILKNPDHHYQGTFFGQKNYNKPELNTDGSLHCGTTMCVAGTSEFLAKDGDYIAAKRTGNVESQAAKRLGLTNEEEIDALFYEMDEDRAMAKLKKIVLGKEFKGDDFKTKN